MRGGNTIGRRGKRSAKERIQYTRLPHPTDEPRNESRAQCNMHSRSRQFRCGQPVHVKSLLKNVGQSTEVSSFITVSRISAPINCNSTADVLINPSEKTASKLPASAAEGPAAPFAPPIEFNPFIVQNSSSHIRANHADIFSNKKPPGVSPHNRDLLKVLCGEFWPQQPDRIP